MNKGYALIAPLALLIALASPAAHAQGLAITARINSVDGKDVTLDKGVSSGIEPKMVFDVYSDAKVVRLPLAPSDEPVFVRQKVIAQLIIRAVSDGTARAELYGKAKGALKTGQTVLYNPSEKASNQPPFFASISPAPKSRFAWREKASIQLTVINEPEDEMFFEWSCRAIRDPKSTKPVAFEGGLLLQSRTSVPKNTWIAPYYAGKYRIRVVAYDTAGKSREAVFDYICTGARRGAGASVSYGGVAADPQMFQNIRDINYDYTGTLYVLQAGSKSFVGGTSPSIKVISPQGEVKEVAELPKDHADSTRLVVTPRALFLLDPENSAVKRFALSSSGGIATTLRGRPIVFGKSGVGNGKFSTPVDLCVDGEGHVAVLDLRASAIQVFENNGTFLYSLGMEGRGRGQMLRPVALASGPGGSLFCLDDGRKAILVFRKGRFEREITFTSKGSVTGLAYDPFLAVLGWADLGSGVVRRYSLDTNKLLPPRPGGRLQPSMERLIKLKDSGMVRCNRTSSFVVVDREGSSLARFDADNSLSYGFLGRLGGVDIGDSLKITASPSGDLVILNTSSKIVTRVERTGWIDLRLGGSDSLRFTFKSPVDVAVGDTGAIYVLDAEISRVFQFTSLGVYLGTLGAAGERPRQLNSCIDLDCSGDRQYLMILQDRKGHNIHQMDFKGRGQAWPRLPTIEEPVVGCRGTDKKFWVINDDVLGFIPAGGNYRATNYSFDEVTDMATGVDGQLYIVDYGDYFISVRSSAGGELGKIKLKEVSKPRDIALDNYGRIFVFDSSSEKVHWLD